MESFLDDPTLTLNGYQADFMVMDQGLFLFTHNIPACQSTLALRVKAFKNLLDPSRHHANFLGTESCNEHCMDEHDLERCVNPCKFAWVRELIQLVKEWKKRES